MKEPVALGSSVHRFGHDTWEVKRERLDAEWTPLVDEKRRKVHGWACVEEVPPHMLGRTIDHGTARLIFSAKPFSVQLIATRDGQGFGAFSAQTWYATREEALAHARKALVQQGKRYAKKYGGAS